MPLPSFLKSKWIAPAVILALLVLAILHSALSQAWFRYYTYVFGPIFAVLGLWIWFVRGSGLPQELSRKLVWRTRIALGVFLLLFLLLLRPDGSWKGTSLIKFTWRWSTPAPEPTLPEFPPKENDGASEPELASASDWPQYLGPNRDGFLPDVHLEADWEAHPPKLIWKREVGLGWGSMAISGGRVVTMEQRGARELVCCYDLATGNPLWSQGIASRFEGPMGGAGPRSTPTLHADRVFAQFADGMLYCLDLKTGDLIWSRDVLKELKVENLKYGKSNAPLVSGNQVIVTGGITGPVLASYSLTDGNLLWLAEPGEASYASPSVITLAGKEQLVSVNGRSVSAHVLDSGETLWRWAWDQDWPKAGQPHGIEGDHLLLTASYGQGAYLLDCSGVEPSVIWRNLRMKTKFSSAVVKDGYAYGLDEGIFACIDVATGDRQWKGGRYGFGQNILVGDHLIVQAEDGYVTLLNATAADFEELARLDALEGTTWNVPAFASPYLLVRNGEEMACYELALRQ